MFLVALLIDLYSLVLFVSVVLSWFRLPDENPLIRFTNALTEPVLRPIRSVLPPVQGFDFSPMLLLIALRLLRRLLVG